MVKIRLYVWAPREGNFWFIGIILCAYYILLLYPGTELIDIKCMNKSIGCSNIINNTLRERQRFKRKYRFEMYQKQNEQ